MNKVYVAALAQQSCDLYMKLAKTHGFSDEEIEQDKQNKIHNLFDGVMLSGLRSCGNFD